MANNPLHKQMLASFDEWYLQEKGMPFVWSGKENNMLDYIYRQLKDLCRRTNCSEHDDMIFSLWVKMYTSLKKVYPWLYQHCSVANIACKFNELIALIRNNKQEEQTNINFEIINEMINKNDSTCKTYK